MGGLSRLHTDKADTQHLRLLLRACHERPRGCRAAEHRNEIAPPKLEHAASPLRYAGRDHDHRADEDRCGRSPVLSAYHAAPPSP
jgi:hypothetical protein